MSRSIVEAFVAVAFGFAFGFGGWKRMIHSFLVRRVRPNSGSQTNTVFGPSRSTPTAPILRSPPSVVVYHTTLLSPARTISLSFVNRHFLRRCALLSYRQHW